MSRRGNPRPARPASSGKRQAGGRGQATPAPRPGVPAAPVELVLDGFTHGGEAVGRLPDGRACFVPYAIPGERVLVQVVEDRGRWTRGRLVTVLEASPDRVEPPCPYFGEGRCGGCQLQHIAPDAQRVLKQRVVAEQFARIGRLPDAPVAATVPAGDFRYRNAGRFAVDVQGRLGFRRAGTREVLPIDDCLLLAESVQALRVEAGDDWGEAQEVVVRGGLATGDRALTVHSEEAVIAPPGDAPVAVAVNRSRSTVLRGQPTITEVVGGHRFRISPTSFFQGSTAGAELLTELVLEAADVRPGDRALDLYAGVGLFAVALADRGAEVVAVEGDRAAAADAKVNLAAWQAQVLEADAEKMVARLAASQELWDIVVLDPPRKGAGAATCAAIAALRPRVVVYVACDPAALARDARALTDAGYPLVGVVPVDQFAQTAQIEAVATFARAPG